MSRPAQLKPLLIELLATKHLLTVPEMLEALEKSGVTVNKTSVYRALENLVSDNTVHRQSFGENDIRYELQNHHHDHLVCVQCGKILNAACLVKLPRQVNDFKVAYHTLTVYGWCQQCQIAKG